MKFQLKKKGLAVLLLMGFVMLFAAANALANPYAKYAGTTLVINFPNIAYYNYAVQVIPEFTKETGIKVEIDKLDYMKMRDKQLLEMSKPKGDYDLISYVIMWKTEYVSKGLLSPLAPFFTNAALADPDYDAADLVPGYVQAIGTVGGRKGYLPGPTASVYGVPFGTETSMFAYRKDIFEKHGWKVPKTYDEMLKLCKLVKEKEPGMGGITMRGQAGHQVQHAWLNHLTPYGGEVFDDKWEFHFHKGGSIQAIKAMIEMVKTGPPGIPTFEYGAMTDAFLLGKAAMYLDNTALPGQVRDPNKSKVVGKVGYALHPEGSQTIDRNRRVRDRHPGELPEKRSGLPASPVADLQGARLQDYQIRGHAQPALDSQRPGNAERLPGIRRRSGKPEVCQPRLAPIDPRVAGNLPCRISGSPCMKPSPRRKPRKKRWPMSSSR